MIVTRDIEVRSIPAKATLTGLMEELWLKFEGKERWIKSLQMGNNLLEKYFYWHGLEWQLGTFFVFGRSSNTVRLINWQTRKFGTEAQTFSVLTLLWRKGVCLSWGPATGEKEHNDWTEGKLYRCFMWLQFDKMVACQFLPVTPWYQIWFELWYFWYMSLNQIKDTILNLIQDLPLANPIV